MFCGVAKCSQHFAIGLDRVRQRCIRQLNVYRVLKLANVWLLPHRHPHDLIEDASNLAVMNERTCNRRLAHAALQYLMELLGPAAMERQAPVSFIPAHNSNAPILTMPCAPTLFCAFFDVKTAFAAASCESSALFSRSMSSCRTR